MTCPASGERQCLSGILRYVFLTVLAVAALAGPLSREARACESCGCDAAAHAMMRAYIVNQHQQTKAYIEREFALHRSEFILGWFFPEHILPMMMMAAEQLTAVAMHQMLVIGAFFDADNTIRTLRVQEELRARAHKDYHPSLPMCEIGTMTRSLAPAQRNAEYTSFVLAQRQQTRERRADYAVSATGPASDIPARLDLFRKRYCDIRDSYDGLKSLCRNMSATQMYEADTAQQNWEKDVDYERVIDHPLTLRVDFSNAADNAAEDADEKDIMALSNNLYSHEVFEYIKPFLLEPPANQPYYLDVRAVLAKRSVAENSFNAIVGMKAQGSEGSGVLGATGSSSEDTAGYMRAIFKQLGVGTGSGPAVPGVTGGGAAAEKDLEDMLGERPSYYAQMEVLTKKIYQRPEFYTNLYDTPANTARKEAALRAIGLMQDMDKFKSQLRSEALLSVILETELERYRIDLQSRMGRSGDAVKK